MSRYAAYRRQVQRWWDEAQSWEPTGRGEARRAVEEGYGSAYDIAEVQPKWLAECRAHLEAGVSRLVEREKHISPWDRFNFTRAMVFPPDQALPSDVAERLISPGSDSSRWGVAEVDPHWRLRENADQLEHDRMLLEYLNGIRAVVGWDEAIAMRREVWIQKNGVWHLSPKIIKAGKSGLAWYDTMQRFKPVALETELWIFGPTKS